MLDRFWIYDVTKISHAEYSLRLLRKNYMYHRDQAFV